MLRKNLLLLLVLIFSAYTSLSRPLLEPNKIIKTLHDIDILMNNSNGNDDDDEDREDDDDDSIVNPAVRDSINNSTKNVTLSLNNASKTKNVTAGSISNNRTSRNSSTYSVTRNSIVEKKSVYTKTENGKSVPKTTTRDGGIGPGQRLTSEQQIPPPPPPPEPPKTDVDFHKGIQETKILNPISLKLTEKKAANKGQQTPDQHENDYFAKSDIDERGELNDGNEESEESSTQDGQEAEVEVNSEKQQLEQSETRDLVEDQEGNSKPDEKEQINPETNVQQDNAITNGNIYKSVADDNREEPESNNQKDTFLHSNLIENEVRDFSGDSDNNDKVKMFFISPFDKSEGSNDNSLKTRQILTYPASGHGHTVNHHWGPSHIWNSDYPYFAYGYSWGCGHHGYGPHILRQRKSNIKNNKKSSDLICRDYVLLPALTKTFLAVPITQNGDFDETGIARQIVSKDIACNDNDPVCTQKQVIGSMAGGSLFGDGMGGLGMGFPGIPGLHTGISGYNEGGGFGNDEHRDGESSYVEGSHHLPSSGHGSIGRGGFGLQGMHGGYHGHHGRDNMATLEPMRPISEFINNVYQHAPNIWSDKSTNPETKSAKADKKAIVKNTKKSSKRFFHFPGLGYSLMDTNGFSGGTTGNVFGGSFGGFGYPTAYPAQSAVLAPLVSPNNIHDELNGWGSKYINQGSSFAGWGKNFVGPIATPGTVEEGDVQSGGGPLPFGSGVVRIAGGFGNTGHMDGAAFIGETNVLDRPPVVGSVNGGLLRGVDFVGHGYKQLANEFEGNGIGFPYVVRPDNVGNHRFSSYSANGVVPSNLDVTRHGNFVIKSKIKSKKKGKQKKKASVKGVARQDIAMPDEQALMDVTKQRQLIGSLGASTLFADNVGGIGLGHPGVPQMSSGISGIPGEYGGTGGYAHGWDGEGPGLNTHGYNDFGYNMGKDDRDYDQHERSNPAPRPEKSDEG